MAPAQTTDDATDPTTPADPPEFVPPPSVAAELARRPIIDTMHPQQLALVRSTVAAGASNAEVGQFLQLAAHLNLSPFNREIWCAKSKGRDGREGRLLIMVGRDGLLKNARRFEDYRGYDCDVVHANDRFMRGAPDPDAKTMRARAGVEHTYGKPGDRGEVVGAWCVAEREGQPIRYFYAPLEEYKPGPGAKLDYSPWGSQVSVMIEKCALSIVHRTLCNITGVLVDAEADRMLYADAADAASATPEDVLAGLLADVPGEVATRLRQAVTLANTLEPNSWNAAKCQMTFAAKTPEELLALAEVIEGENEIREAEQPVDAEVVSAEDDAADTARLEELRERERVLTDELATLAVGTGARTAVEGEMAEVRAEIRQRGGASPGQGNLGV